jgi:hypothetical protein
MSDALQYPISGLTVGFEYYNAILQVWSVAGGAYENWTNAHYNSGNYTIAATEQGASGLYVATTPAGVVSAGAYSWAARKHVDGTITNDQVIGNAGLYPLTLPGLSGTATAGGASTITLGVSAPDKMFVGQLIVVNIGTVNQQVRKIVTYISNVATVDFPWIAPIPSNGTPFVLPGVNPQSTTTTTTVANQVIVNQV